MNTEIIEVLDKLQKLVTIQNDEIEELKRRVRALESSTTLTEQDDAISFKEFLAQARMQTP